MNNSVLNLVLSYGDLSYQSGYRTRVIGELLSLDRQAGVEPFLLAFDRNPEGFDKLAPEVPYRVFNRSQVVRFYPAVVRLAHTHGIRLVHAHNLYSAVLALSAKPFCSYKVVFDYHGRIPEEYVSLGKGGEPSRKALEVLEAWAVRNSDHVVAVSDKLADYLKERYRLASTKISVIPCCADDSIFRWDPGRRATVRQSMNLSGKLLCTHLGTFFDWYDPKLLLRAFDQLRNRFDSHLLVITPNIENTRRYLSSRLAANTFTVMQADHASVPGLLNASDLGCLLLRPSANIETSSPAKFSEYLNCGLPVLITPGVGDFSALVARERVGQILGGEAVVETDFIESLIHDRENIAARSAAAGQRLTWQAFRSTWSKIADRFE
jgi:glycosyltransferase involved in cell wall biosynthesis